MAQKPGADSLIASLARHASVRVILALAAVVLALALAGCGGSSGGSSTASTDGPGAQQQRTAAGDGAAASPSTGSSSTAAGSAKQPSSPPSATGGAQGAAKPSSHVQIPKGEPEKTATPAEEAQATVADIALSSPAVGPDGALPATYTCGGRNSWPKLQWQGVPEATEELVLFAMNAQPVGGKLFFDWAVAGLDPSLEGLGAGKLPKGAVIGTNSFGKNDYEICPPSGQAETYVFALYALPKRLASNNGFDPHALREEALGVSGNAGLLAVSYERG